MKKTKLYNKSRKLVCLETMSLFFNVIKNKLARRVQMYPRIIHEQRKPGSGLPSYPQKMKSYLRAATLLFH